MKEFNFEKNGIKFKFRNPELDKYDYLRLEYKIVGIEESKHNNDGYFCDAKFDKKKKAITFYQVEFDGKFYNGVKLPDDVYKELLDVYEVAIKEREKKVEEIIEKIIEGEIPIDFGIVGCDYPHYQPWLNNLPKDLKGKEQEIMEKAIYTLYEKLGYNKPNVYISNSCDFLERKLNKGIMNKDDVIEKAFNLKFNKESQDYHGYKEDVVTGFQIKLTDLIDVEEIKAKQEKIRKEKEKVEKRRKTLDIEILKKGKNEGSDGTDYYAIVKLIDPTTKESLTFNCRNVFDVGYVINPEYEIAKGIKGGIIIDNQWHDFKSGKGWYPVRELTEFEKQCIDYLREFSPIEKSVRL